ncbi:hypothetical protein [Nitriliruptor alkaliphilus]|uniref:hypothetical protein n=1 Tax=Nitriliruptor alkaliphilus TaxID=427918 RepID=UPI00069673C4|nr:hypothetical protein [Nitriliruptor alkaliphilus]
MTTPGASDNGLEAVPSADELQRAIASVTGVTTAEVSRASNGRDRLRISLAPGEDPEAVAWSVAATLRERFGIALDPAAISARAIADPSDDPVRVISRVEPAPNGRRTPDWPPPPPVAASAPAGRDRPEAPADDTPTEQSPAQGAAADGAPRPVGADRPAPADLVAAARATLADDEPSASGRSRAAIDRLSAEPVGDELDVTATLSLSGRAVTGRARGIRTRRGRWRAISEATLDALGSLSADRVRGHVDHVTVLTFADLAHVSVSVTLLTDSGEETFLGAALVREDPDRAVMRATLDAVNRRVEPWLAEAAISEAG